MNPLQKNKINVKDLSPEEQRLFRLYGKLPTKSDHFAKHLKERKYFDSGDYALSKAGKADSVDTGTIGSQHPVPENIPHLSSPVSGHGGQNHFGRSGSTATDSTGTGTKHPHVVGVVGGPHPTPQGIQAGSPVKESSFLNRETSAEDGAEQKPTET